VSGRGGASGRLTAHEHAVNRVHRLLVVEKQGLADDVGHVALRRFGHGAAAAFG
jgi:hypothetical protein